LYEVGKKGIKAGMRLEEVYKILGNEKEREEKGPLGAFNLVYDSFSVLFIDFQVVSITERS
jgi:hypothetical protein